MNKTFMKFKRIVIPVLSTMLIMAQLTGCASSDSKEMLEALKSGEVISIEVAMPEYAEEEQGEEQALAWEELASLSTYPEFRRELDDSFYVTALGESGKNGPMYIDLEGNHTNNSTLYYATQNKKFVEYFNDTAIKDALSESIQSVYGDIEASDSQEVKDSAIINAYFNLFADNTPDYGNMNSAVTRAEFMGAVAKADTPVDAEATTSETLLNAVGENAYNTLCSYTIGDAYLNESHIDAQTYTAPISRAEAVYLLVNRYFSDELSKVDTKAENYTDVKNAGDIAYRSKLTSEENSTDSNYRRYEIALMVQNPEKGVTSNIWKAFAIAKQYNLIEGSTANWDEALTKSDAIQLLLSAYSAIAERDGYAVDSIDGLSEGETIDRNTGSSTTMDDYDIEGDSNGAGSDVEVNGSVADGITLTDEERQQILANANANYTMEKAIDEYNKVTAPGGHTYEDGVTISEAVGSPYDTSWRRMTDEEAQAILNGEAEGDRWAAEAELANGAWMSANKDILFYDYYKWADDAYSFTEEHKDELISYSGMNEEK